MKFPATSFWNAVARGAAKVVIQRVYVRKVTDLTLALNTGTWIEITDRLESIPQINLAIEYDVGQYRANPLSFTAIGITWFKANVFNATASEYIELKVECKIGLSEARLATDLAYMYCGFIDKRVRFVEADDSVHFTVMTADDLLAGIAVENISTQYVDPDTENGVDILGSAGHILFNIPGVWVTDANIASFVLRAGTHTLTYGYNGGSPQVKLDDGDFVALSGGTTKVLANGPVDQKVEIYYNPTKLSTSDATEKIIVTTPGNTIPQHFYHATNTKRLISKILEKCGITTVVFDALEFNSHDGGSRVSFIETPPNDESESGYRRAITTDGTDLWIGAGNKLYKRTMTTETYELKATCDSGYTIVRLFHNTRNNHIWIALWNGTNLKLNLYDIGGDSLGTSITLNTTVVHSLQLMDYEYSAGNWKYGICYIDGVNSRFRFVNSSLTDSLISTSANSKDGFAYIRNANEYWWQTYDTIVYKIHGFSVDGSGNWTNLGAQTHQPTYIYQQAAFIPSEDRIYFWDSAQLKVRSTVHNTVFQSDLLTLSSGDSVDCFHFGNSKVYFTTKTAGKLYQAVSNAVTLLYEAERTYAANQQLAYLDRLYGLDEYGILFQYHTAIRMFVRDAETAGTARDLLTKVCQAYLLLYTISPIKAGYIYRRGNSSGTPQTSGNTLAVTVTDADLLEEDTLRYEAVALARVSNGLKSATYNGTTFDAEVLSDVRTLEITNDFIPTSLLRDVAYWLYQFFKTNRTLYRFQMPVIPLFQYEPFDNCSVTFNTTKILKTGSGPIYEAGYLPDGSLEVGVLM